MIYPSIFDVFSKIHLNYSIGWTGNQAQYYAAAAQYYQNEYNAHQDVHPATTDADAGKGRRDRNSSDYSRGGDRYKHDSGYNDKSFGGVTAEAENTKKTKGLPLWLRQGLLCKI